MKNKMYAVRGLVYSRFKSEAECARKLGWSRQKLNKITNGQALPDINDLNELSVVLCIDAGELLHIFLDGRSTNGQPA